MRCKVGVAPPGFEVRRRMSCVAFRIRSAKPREIIVLGVIEFKNSIDFFFLKQLKIVIGKSFTRWIACIYNSKPTASYKNQPFLKNWKIMDPPYCTTPLFCKGLRDTKKWGIWWLSFDARY